MDAALCLAALQRCLVLTGFTASRSRALRAELQLNISAEVLGALEFYAQGHEFGTVCDQSRYVI
ncbi:hypothetical protein C8J37_11112 [Rhizobium sp. PP-WC-1G-195]|nr:hypothetical protein C8J37_11112 [Rhizobium sp. PP-WC-1G-195]TCP82678.1 hypothetical protein C8J31_11011 [Rhizobium sp. PP-CC-2G-626]